MRLGKCVGNLGQIDLAPPCAILRRHPVHLRHPLFACLRAGEVAVRVPRAAGQAYEPRIQVPDLPPVDCPPQAALRRLRVHGVPLPDFVEVHTPIPREVLQRARYAGLCAPQARVGMPAGEACEPDRPGPNRRQPRQVGLLLAFIDPG